MKKTNKKALIIFAIVVAVIAIGVIIAIVKGFNFDLLYNGGKRIEVDIGKQFEIKDIEAITKEIVGENSCVQTVEIYKESVSIFAQDMTEEQRNNIITKINEKYGLELKAEESEIINVPHIRLRDIIKPCIIPLVIATIIVLIYIGIKYIRKTNAEILLETIIVIILGQALLFSIFAITRIPVGKLTIPMILSVYVLSTTFCTARLEKYVQEKEKEEEEKNKTEEK